MKDVAGTWKDLTDNVNMMASKITNQVRDIAVVAKAVARGDLTKKVKANAQGEVLELKNTMNKMVSHIVLSSILDTNIFFLSLVGGSANSIFS